MIPHKLKGIYTDKGKLFTKNLVKGQCVYGEALVKADGVEYKQWDPRRSKLGAGIKKNMSQIGIKPGCSVLYLGASSGTTASHVSDIIGKEGSIYALDFSPRMTRDLVFLAKTRENMAPILADAFKVSSYVDKIPLVDVIFQDIAQRNQVEIFLRNCVLLKQGGFGLLAIKARSVDVTKKPKEIFKRVRRQLEEVMTIVDYRELDPYEKDHALFIVKKV